MIHKVLNSLIDGPNISPEEELNSINDTIYRLQDALRNLFLRKYELSTNKQKKFFTREDNDYLESKYGKTLDAFFNEHAGNELVQTSGDKSITIQYTGPLKYKYVLNGQEYNDSGYPYYITVAQYEYRAIINTISREFIITCNSSFTNYSEEMSYRVDYNDTSYFHPHVNITQNSAIIKSKADNMCKGNNNFVAILERPELGIPDIFSFISGLIDWFHIINTSDSYGHRSGPEMIQNLNINFPVDDLSPTTIYSYLDELQGLLDNPPEECPTNFSRMSLGIEYQPSLPELLYRYYLAVVISSDKTCWLSRYGKEKSSDLLRAAKLDRTILEQYVFSHPKISSSDYWYRRYVSELMCNTCYKVPQMYLNCLPDLWTNLQQLISRG